MAVEKYMISQDDPPLPEDDENKEKRTDDISSWDADFLKVDNDNHDDDFNGDIFSWDVDFLEVWTRGHLLSLTQTQIYPFSLRWTREPSLS